MKTTINTGSALSLFPLFSLETIIFKKNPPDMKLLYIPVFLITFSSIAQNFTPESSPIEFSGTLDHFRTVWFSSDNTSVYGDNKSIIGFDIESGNKILEVPIAGYPIHSSNQSSDGLFWIQANSNYNNPNNPQVGDMHNNLGCYDFENNVMKAQKTGDINLWILKCSSIENIAYGISNVSRIASIVEFQVDPFKINRTIAKENNGTYILGLDLNENSGILAYSYAGDSKGIKFIDLESGALKKKISINEEFAPLEFSPDGKALMASAYKLLYKFDVATYESKSFNLDPDKDNSHAFSISVHPNNRSVAFSSKYGTSILDTENGTVKKIDNGQSMACKFSTDGKYLATSVKPFLVPESVCLRVFSDPTFPIAPIPEITEVSDTAEPEVLPLSDVVPPSPDSDNEWYQHSDRAFSIEFPTKPALKTTKSKDNYESKTYTCIHKNSAYIAVVSEVSPKIKTKKYKKLAIKMGEAFIAKINPLTSTNSPYSFEDQEGTKYVFVKDGLSYHYRCVCINGNAYQVICLNAEGHTNHLNRFFDSFKP